VTTTNISEAEIADLKEALKRCPAGTFEAALEYRFHGDSDRIPDVVTGIIERYIEPEKRPILRGADDSLSLVDGLGIDSLTMMEIVLLVEEVLRINFDNEELKQLRTLGDIKSFMNFKIKGEPLPEQKNYFGFERIAALMPQRSPFLFLNSATLSADGAKGTYKIDGTEHFLEGHFKDNPVFPASIMLEALGQLAVLYLLGTEEPSLAGKVSPDTIFFTSCDGVRCHRFCRPGDTLEMEIKVKRIRHPLAMFSGSMTVKGERATFAEEITLLFDYRKETPEGGFSLRNGSH
jgi:3-hydroxymyristoyl/3-hydroxydecanoyl-(acyl carrier protein) dehydratase/acyl carrier protein